MRGTIFFEKGKKMYIATALIFSGFLEFINAARVDETIERAIRIRKKSPTQTDEIVSWLAFFELIVFIVAMVNYFSVTVIPLSISLLLGIRTIAIGPTNCTRKDIYIDYISSGILCFISAFLIWYVS